MATALLNADAAPWGVCYHAQQAVENALKALLVRTGVDPPKTYNLVRLHRMLGAPLFDESDEDMMASLMLWAVQQRYPADQPEPTTVDAQTATANVDRALNHIRPHLRDS